jgi:tRNA 2-thiouridine synthesizing protein E
MAVSDITSEYSYNQGDWSEQMASTVSSAYPHAPANWSEEFARSMALEEGLELNQDHLDELRALQEYCSRHDCNKYSVRELHDALDEKFHEKGGYKFLYKLFPGGPIAQGCRLAGLEPPAGAVDLGFGSVV